MSPWAYTTGMEIDAANGAETMDIARLVRESRALLHTLEHLYNRKGNRYARALSMAETRHERRQLAQWHATQPR
jgi:hypothetical protein